MEDTYELTLDELQGIVKYALDWYESGDWPKDQVVACVPGLVGFMKSQVV